MKIKVFLVDDHPMVIEGLATIIRSSPALEYVGYATSAASCRGFFTHGLADVVLMDINLPDQNGVDLCEELKTKFPYLNILAISSNDQGSFVKNMMEKGASGYVFKNVTKEELIEAITKVAAGQTYLSREANFVMREEKKREASLPVLTRREKEVLLLIAKGLTNPQIAEQLFISLSTVESHRKSLMAKLNTSNTASLLRVSAEMGFLTLN
ncbi:MAG: response regulator transcription factor [Bacteroidetes bacterium]|nr:response regulator transcription factor [Bacteroidota bacterium]